MSLEARDFDLTSMSMQLADGDGVKKRNSSTIDLPGERLSEWKIFNGEIGSSSD